MMRPLLICALLLASLPRVADAQVPVSILFGGTTEVFDDDVAASYPMDVEVYDAREGGSLIWSDTFDNVAIDGGTFTLELGSDGSLASALTGDALYVELTIDGETLTPRFPIGTVPYAARAAEATTATSLGGLSEADVSSELSALADRITALEALEARLEAAELAIAASASACDTCIDEDQLATALDGYALASETDAIRDSVAGVSRLTEIISVEGDGADVVFEGVNVHVRNGLGATDAAPNGLGNLVIGYNEDVGDDASRTGSHNVVMGLENSYSGIGGIVTGVDNQLSGEHAVCLAGDENIVTGDFAGALGGTRHLVSADNSVCIAGEDNETTGDYASVTGGRSNRARGRSSSVSGGSLGDANGLDDWRAGDLFENQ